MTDIEKAWGRRLSSSTDNHISWTMPQTTTGDMGNSITYGVDQYGNAYPAWRNNKALAHLKDFVEKYNEGRAFMKWYNFSIEFEFDNGVAKDVEGKVLADGITHAYNKVVVAMKKEEPGFEEKNVTLFEAYTYNDEPTDVIVTSRRVFDKEEDDE